MEPDRVWICRVNYLVNDVRREACITVPEKGSNSRILKPTHQQCGWYKLEKMELVDDLDEGP